MEKEKSKGLIISIKVIPKASCNEMIGWGNGELKIRISAVPEKGAANKEIVAFLAKEWGIKKRDISLVSGAKSRHKRFFIIGLDIQQIKSMDEGSKK